MTERARMIGADLGPNAYANAVEAIAADASAPDVLRMLRELATIADQQRRHAAMLVMLGKKIEDAARSRYRMIGACALNMRRAIALSPVDNSELREEIFAAVRDGLQEQTAIGFHNTRWPDPVARGPAGEDGEMIRG